MTPNIYYYDIAAVFVMAVSLLSFVVRRKTYTPANRVYFGALLLISITSVLSLAGDLFDDFIGRSFTQIAMREVSPLLVFRSSITMLYYTLRSLTAPAYMVLIATVCNTSHKLNESNVVRVLLWGPMLATVAFVLTNPCHHLVYQFQYGLVTRGPGLGVLYAEAAYYSVIGIAWLFYWRRVLSNNEFATLMMLYPLVFVSVIIQFWFPYIHLEMFVTSVGMMLVSAFVLRPELQLDSLVNAASLHAYRETCSRALATYKPMCLVYLEIVNMEQLRALMGREEIKGVLRGVTKSLNAHLERGDVLHYLRDGMFCIIPTDTNAEHAQAIAQKAHNKGKARALEKGDSAMEVRMRSCVVRTPEDVSDINTLRTFVLRFSHLVPESGVTTYEELSKRDDFELQMALPTIVNRAIRERSFQVYYQPIYCLKDNRFHSAEALVRLHDPTYGWIPPSLFIPEAEQTGTIIQIGNILLDKICTYLGTIDYNALGLSYVELNLSVEQCIRPQLAGEILRRVHEHGVDPSRINLEITETSSSFSQRVMENNIRTLAAEGITFSLDDYGTGYSNVTRVLELPFTLVKFDKSFVDGIDNTRTQRVLARSISMMREIGKEVLVEGVEDPAQEDALRGMGVDYVQGYLYSRPMPESEFVAFLRRDVDNAKQG